MGGSLSWFGGSLSWFGGSLSWFGGSLGWFGGSVVRWFAIKLADISRLKQTLSRRQLFVVLISASWMNVAHQRFGYVFSTDLMTCQRDRSTN
jgi:hypothetical protein